MSDTDNPDDGGLRYQHTPYFVYDPELNPVQYHRNDLGRLALNRVMYPIPRFADQRKPSRLHRLRYGIIFRLQGIKTVATFPIRIGCVAKLLWQSWRRQ